MFSCRIALGRMARACRTTAADQAGRACSPPDHPARLKVENVTRQVSWLAPFQLPAAAAVWRDDAFPRVGAVAVSIRCRCLQLRGQPRLVPRSRLSFGLAEEPRSGKATQWLAGGQPLARLDSFSACEIERRPRGASRAALAPTFVSGQLCLGDLRANPLAHASISRRMNQAVARASHRPHWPETNVDTLLAVKLF